MTDEQRTDLSATDDAENLEDGGGEGLTEEEIQAQEEARMQAEEDARIEAERVAAEDAAAEAVKQIKPAPKLYQPQFQASSLTEEESARVKTTLAKALSSALTESSWDPEVFAQAVAEQVVGVSEDIAARRVNTTVRNMMASEARGATTPEEQIQIIARNKLYAAAERNPAIYDDPNAQSMAQYAAAMEYGAQIGDIDFAMDVVRNSRQARIDPPTQPSAPPAPRRERETFVPVPTPGNGIGGSRRGGGNSELDELRKRYPYIKDEESLRLLANAGHDR